MASPNFMSPPDSPGNATARSRKSSTEPKKRTSQAEQRGIPGRLACDVCRERKVRCDRADPKCSRCTRLGYQCSYHGRTRTKASQADLPRQLAEIQNRLAQAEAQLAAAPELSLSDHFPCQSDLSFQSFQDYGLEKGMGMQIDIPTSIQFPDMAITSTSQDEFALANFDWKAVETPTIETNGQATTPIDTSNNIYVSLEVASPPLVSKGELQQTAASPHPKILKGCEISAEQMASLHDNYFELLYPHMPILSKERFSSERSSPRSSIERGLDYAVALVGALIEPDSLGLQRACYGMARKFVEMCEQDEEGTNLTSLGVFQALLFIIRYELTAKRFTRAWMTLGRAVRLATILNLNEMDRPPVNFRGQSELQQLLPETQDPSILEERRRSLWVLYIFEGYASTRTGLPCQLQDNQIIACLPSPGSLDDGFQPLSMPFLSETTTLQGIPHISNFAGIVLMISLARKTYEHGRGQSEGYWDRHYRLVRLLNERTSSLSIHLTAKTVQEDIVAFSLYLNLCAIEIYLHEAAIDEVMRENLPKLVADESRKRSGAAAFKIASAVRMNWPAFRSKHDMFTLQGSFIGWALVMGIKALTRHLLDVEDGVSNGAADSLRLLIPAIDQLEDENGHWHSSIAGASGILRTWDERHSGFHMGE
ncbi:uncharacterized protein RSE6_12468 [Rhynchosporium secalis]|uniref:Zn(2)-C6 fungal-type domain-containing protein n=1 Tax=Rhynchosporium secalis TaxID=38038 RepID=A0A1E1MQG7_RHYSE|nr:uncharacterized protein RSE6_12468 [Rhynchosporium secalis]